MRLTGETRVLAVWGHPVSHSRSPAMHNAALQSLGLAWVYVPFDVAPANVAAAVAGLRAMNFVGANVTVPLKEVVSGHLDDLDDEAARIGSVNTIHNVAGRLRGYSTDGAGFLRALEAAGETTEGRQAYVLGAGGSARAVSFALAGRGAMVQIANRTAERAAALAAQVNRFYPDAARTAGWGSEAAPFDLLVNTTSLGMHPHLETAPALPPGTLRPGLFVYDLVYAPPETALLAQARAAGCRTENGLGMLVFQGALSLSLWTGLPVADLPIEAMGRAAGEVG